jgi:adenylate cyclase
MAGTWIEHRMPARGRGQYPAPVQPGEPIDFEAEGLLAGLEGDERNERLALLEYLTADGVPLADLHRATEGGTLMFLVAGRVIAGEARYTSHELAELGGVSLEFLIDLIRAMGLAIPDPGEVLYTDSDLEVVRTANVARATGITDEEILELLRTLGRGLAQAAETMRALVLRVVLEPGVTEPDLARRYADATAQLSPILTPLIGGLLNLHLRQAAEGEAINSAERSGGRLPGSREIFVCFADLVGFTRLGEEVQPEELGQLAARLEALAAEVSSPPVRLVKTIGDAVMLTSPEPAPLVEAALTLIEAVDAAEGDFPRLRAGIASGHALSRAGDWFGRPVNLASRITSVARAGSLLVAAEVREALGDGYRWSDAGERRLRGIREPVRLFRARRLPRPG